MPDDVTTESTSSPATPAAGTDPNGAGSASPTAGLLTQEQVNSIVAKEHRKGGKEAVSALLAQLGVESVEALEGALKAARPETEKQRLVEKQRLDEERQKMAADLEATRRQLDEERVKNHVYPILAGLNVRKPALALHDIHESTGHSVAHRDGRFVVVDVDGDVVGTDPAKWLAEQIKRDEFALHVRPTTVQSPKTPPKPADGSKPQPQTFGEAFQAAFARSQSGEEQSD